MRRRLLLALLLRAARALTVPRRAARRPTALASLKVTILDPDDAAAQGVREWPFSSRPAGDSEETVAAGTVRYVLKGEGEVEWSDYAGGVAAGDAVAVGPGSLVEAEAQCNVRWRSDAGFTILTPGFEDWSAYGGVLAAVAAVFAYLFATFAS